MAEEIKPLTSIRGIAATLVMVYHYHQLDNISNEALMSFIKKGYLWVDLFFVLSGFVMAMTYSQMFSGKYKWENHRDFLLKRIARIYPLYIFMTVGISIYSLLIYGGYQNTHRPAVNLEEPFLAHITNILMVQAWGFGKSIGGPTWSISTEWAAYLLFPLLLQLCIFSSRIFAYFIACISAAILYYVAVTPEVGQNVRNGQFDVYHGKDILTLLRCLGGFSIGLLTYRFSQYINKSSYIYSDAVASPVIFALIVAMALNLQDIIIYPLLPFLVLTLYGNKGKVSDILSRKLFYMLGVLSYSIYLLHAHFHVVLEQLRIRLTPLISHEIANIISAIIVYTAVFVGAYICYNFIEKPGRNWFRKFSR